MSAIRMSRRSHPVAGEHRLRQRNIHVLPTQAGLLFASVVLAMLVASINYQLSLGYALSFLIAAIGWIAMFHSWRNLSGLILRAGRAEPVFAGEFVEVSLIVRNTGSVERFALSFTAPEMARPEHFDLAPRVEQIVPIALRVAQRGWQSIPRLTLQTRFPLGIWRAWTNWQPALDVLVYPRPEPPGVPLPARRSSAGEGQARGAGEQDLAALRPWQPGDASRRIAWKAMARTASEDLIVRQYEGGDLGELWLDWDDLPADWDIDRKLSRLTRWLLDADLLGARYALQLPGAFLPADAGAAHRVRCLEMLATWGLPDAGAGPR